MTRITPYLALALLGLTGCNTDSVREASAQQIPSNLSGDSGTQSASASQQAHELRRVWSGPDHNFYYNEPSPDGRYVSEISWATGDLALRDLMTGELVLVTNQRADTGAAYGAPWGSVFSSDGERLAYGWRTAGSSELRTINRDGSDRQVLVASRPDIERIRPVDWSPSGSQILALVQRPDGTMQMALIAVPDGSIQILKSLGWRWPVEAAFSPDGRYVAYDLLQSSPTADTATSGIHVLAVDGSQEFTVAQESSVRSHMLGWTPGGDHLLFTRREGRRGSIWQVPVENGRPTGEPVLLEADVLGSPIGFSRDAYYFGLSVESQQVHTATIDPSGGGFVVNPAPVKDPGSQAGSWSPDGRQLAYIARRGIPPSGPILVVRAADGGTHRELPLNLAKVHDIVWAPNGASVFVAGTGGAKENVGPAIYRVDLVSGEVTFLVRGPREAGEFAVSRDGRSLYIARELQGIVRFDLSTGEETLVYADPSSLHALVAVSPDGATLAFTAADTASSTDPVNHGSLLLVMPSDGQGVAREVYRTHHPEHLSHRTGLSWTPDGRALLFERFVAEETPSDEKECSGTNVCRFLSRIAIDGGTPQDLVQLDCTYTATGCRPLRLRVHPDGRRIAFNWGNSKGEIWMMTGFGVGDVASGESQGR